MILAADLHLRATRPRCRKDDYRAAQERKLRFILDLARQSPPLLVAGDFFHVARPGEELLAWVIGLLDEYNVVPVVVPGQHDLPGHSLEQLHRSGVGVLEAAGAVNLIIDPKSPLWLPYLYADLDNTDMYVHGCPYGTEPSKTVTGHPGVLLWHHMVINEVPIWPGQVADKAHSLLRKYPQFNLIVTGDNHESFAIAGANRPGAPFKHQWIINPGSMMRMTAAQTGHRPCVYGWNNGKVKHHPLPVEDDVFDLTELEEAKGKDARIQAFVDRLESRWEAGLSFQKNLEEFLRANPVDAETEALVRGCLEGGAT